jgi:nicotinamide-nucleotide amidase
LIAETIAIGNELISGSIVDTNSSFVSRQFALLGLDVRYHTAVGDDLDDIQWALRTASQRADVALICGGLGPTADDITTDAAARCLGADLVLDDKALDALRRRFQRMGLEMTPNNEKQARFPRGAEVIINPWGSAAGFMIRNGRCRQFFLPGVPQELENLILQEVIPRLQAEINPGLVFLNRSFRIFGLSESKMDQMLSHLNWNSEQTRLASLPHFPEIELKITARGPTEAEAAMALKEMEGQVRRVLDDYIFAVDLGTMEGCIGELLRERGWTLSVAESCTGGLIGHRITQVPGSSDYFERGLVTYSNRSKVELLGVPEDTVQRHGAVSRPTALAMARGVRERSGSHVGLATTGIAGPTGGTPEKPVGTVFVAVDTAETSVCKHYQFRGDRNRIKTITAQVALDLLRRILLGRIERGSHYYEVKDNG